MTFRQTLASRIPPIARRDAELARRRERMQELAETNQRLRSSREELTRQLRAAEERADVLARTADTSVPSFHRHLTTLRRTQVDLRTLDPELRHPLRHLPFKLRNYRLAASHGIPVPAVLEVWPSVSDISFDVLPDSFALKADGGAGGHGVLPLRRVGDGRFETVDGVSSFDEDELRDHFATRAAAGRISGPFFAEELLVQPGGGPIPDDIKLYTMYGEVALVFVRRMGRHADLRSVSRRYLDDGGADLGDALEGSPSDPSLPTPDHFDQIVDIGRHLSLAVGLPFARVDLYATEAGPVLGEITRSPGGAQLFAPEQDQALGRAWERAAYRLDLDVLAGRPPGVVHGPHPAPNLYPQDHVSRSAEAGAWEPTVVPCGTWCASDRA